MKHYTYFKNTPLIIDELKDLLAKSGDNNKAEKSEQIKPDSLLNEEKLPTELEED